LRNIVNSLGGVAHGFPREDHFDITVASEVMAIFCLATDLNDLQRRLGNIVVGFTRDRKPVKASEIKAPGAMTALLKDALAPNLVQTLENNAAFVHGGPFANIAHGCNTVLATKTALKLADYVVTEAGFGADLGAEKFLDIKCRKSGLSPDCVVLVATIRALKMHGGVAKDDLKKKNLQAIKTGGRDNITQHIENLKSYGVPVVVAINKFSADTPAEVALVQQICSDQGVKAIEADHWAAGSEGTEELANVVVDTIDNEKSDFGFLYPDDMPLIEKVRTIAQKIYRADDISVPPAIMMRFKELEELGYGNYPVCIAKTQYSFSTDPTAKGAPRGHDIPVREVRLSGGAEFIVVVCGDIMTMPGLPRVPAAEAIGVDKNGVIVGLF
jgi:formate--tetrahydrofolate ligase